MSINLKEQLTDEQYKDYDFVRERIKQLQKTRQDVFGINLDTKIWNEADRAYIPHRLKERGKKIIATDEEKGWRGNLVTLECLD